MQSMAWLGMQVQACRHGLASFKMLLICQEDQKKEADFSGTSQSQADLRALPAILGHGECQGNQLMIVGLHEAHLHAHLPQRCPVVGMGRCSVRQGKAVLRPASHAHLFIQRCYRDAYSHLHATLWRSV